MDVGKPIVAVVDDDPGIRDSLIGLLKLAGYQSAVFASADEFVHAAPALETECLVLDVKLPGMNGLQLQRLMKTARPSLPLIFISAHYDEDIRNRCMNEGAVSFFPKPFDSAELLRAIAACIPSERHTQNLRIARETQGRVIQGLSSASPQVHGAPDRRLECLRVRAWLALAIHALRRAIYEGRQTVQDLLSRRDTSSKLVELFAQMQEELNQFRQPGKRPNLYIICEGSAQALRPAVQDEVYRIGREALINALRHAHARNIEIVVVFQRNSLSLNVRDDGCGIKPRLVAASNNEHLGLKGICDRADNIGARLSVWSASGCGTELELKLPGCVAFPDD